MHDEHGRLVDASGIDDPKRAGHAGYEPLGNEFLRPLLPTDLEVDGFVSPHRFVVAALAWFASAIHQLGPRLRLRNLDQKRPEEKDIIHWRESGAVATTLLRNLAWKAAESGYPTLIARAAPFSISGLEITNLLTQLVAAADCRSPPI